MLIMMGIVDLVAINAETDTITLFTGLLNGSFVLESTFSTGSGVRPSSITVGHLNDDDLLDLAVTNEHSNTISLFIQSHYPRVIEQKSNRKITRENARKPLIADFNGDQHMDIAVVHKCPRSMGVFLGDGTGNFTDQFILPIDDETCFADLLAADINQNNLLPTKIIMLLDFNHSNWSEIIT